MKTRVYYILFFALTLLNISIFISCRQPCPNPPDQSTVNLSSFLKQYVLPYKDYDTIKCLRNHIDSILFFGSKIQSGYNSSYDQNECPKLIKGQWMSQMFSNHSTDSFLLNYYIVGSYPVYSILFDNELFGPYDASDIWYNINTDTMYVLGKPYSSPFRMIQYPNDSHIVTNDTIYYRNGIVRIKYQNNIYEKAP
jgi:hypothetical protein